MSFVHYYRNYVHFVAKYTPFHRWAIPMATVEILLLLAAGVSYLLVGDHWITATLAIIGCSFFGTLCYTMKMPWEAKGEEKGK
ncbi:hypothetical protein ACLBXM_09595 [Xanthobacteraceae bacterium A53D]